MRDNGSRTDRFDIKARKKKDCEIYHSANSFILALPIALVSRPLVRNVLGKEMGRRDVQSGS